MSFDEQPDGDPHGECAAEIHRLETENKRLRAFAQDVIGEWPECCTLDGGDIQELATKHGLFVEERRSEPCGDGCMCAEVVSPEEFATGGVLCYRKTAILLGRQPNETNEHRKG
jgi:hypothetical protein